MMRTVMCLVATLIGTVFSAGPLYADGPAASFSSDNTTGMGALVVWFSDTSVPGTSPITQWSWDFGDGSTGDPQAAVQHPVHYYEFPGLYTVSLTVTTAEGSDTLTQTDLITVAAVPVFRVDIDNGSGTENGLTWPTAFNTIQEGVNAAYAAGGGEVWVARGTYTDAVDAGNVDGVTGNDSCVVWMRDHVVLFGGFSGTESDRTARDPENQPCVIDGAATCRSVIAVSPFPAVLDGITVGNGRVTSNPAKGAGLFAASASSLGIIDCIFTRNTAVGLAGTGFSLNGKSAYGGALYAENSKIFLERGEATRNGALGGDGYSSSGTAGEGGAAGGGGLYLANTFLKAVDTELSDNLVKGGTSGYRILADGLPGGASNGGGLYSTLGAIHLMECAFFNNTAGGGSGGATFTFSRIGGVGGSAYGGGIYNASSALTLTGTSLYLNTALGGTGGNGPGNAGAGGAAEGGGLYDAGPASFFSACSADANTASGGAGGLNNAEVPAAGGAARGGGLYICGSGYDCTSNFSSVKDNVLLGGEGIPAGAVSGRELYTCSHLAVLDGDGDGLPCWFEEDQGCDPGTDDAALWVSFEFPSPGASFRTLPIPLSGKVASPDVTPLGRSEDGGNVFTEIGVPDAALAWSNTWSPAASGAYSVVMRGWNHFGGLRDTDPRTIHYQPAAPTAYITNPVHGRHVQGQVSVMGTASAGSAGFGGYTLDFLPGEDPEGSGTWRLVHMAPSEVTDGLLGTWNVVALPEGWYVLRLHASDGAGTDSRTWTTVYVDRDTIPPSAPASLAIAGAVQPGLVADGGAIRVTGQGDNACFLDLAELIDENGTTIQNVTAELTLHANGALRGICNMPTGSGASQVALRVRLRDLAGNVGPATTSNYLVVDNALPTVRIDYLPDNARLFLNMATPETYVLQGTAADTGDSGVARVEIQINSGSWLAATGTESWTCAWTPSVAGSYTVNARATDFQGNVSASASITVTVASDTPAAYIQSPLSGSSFFTGTLISIMGTALDTTDFQDYQVQYKNAGDPDWTLITPVPVTTPVHAGLLAQWDTTSLTSPDYQLQLVVRDTAANISTHTISLGILSYLSLSGIPDLSFYEGSQYYRYAWLPDFAAPRNGAENYTYTLVAPLPPASMGVSIDGEKWLHIQPEADWFGWADVTVRVDNGAGLVADDTFRVQIYNVNDAPSPPTITLTPAQPGDGEELICAIDDPAVDPDDDPFVYYFEWYVSTDGINYGAVQRSASQPANPGGGNADSLSSLATTPGDYWRCVVRAYDGYAWSTPPVSLATRILQASSITLGAAPLTMTLGDAITLTGQISGLDGIAPVGFTSLSPAGVADSLYPEGTVSNAAGAYGKTFLPREASEGRNFWQVRAAWSGDGSHKGATSDWVGFTVAKAQPSLTLTASRSSALVLLQGAEDFSVDATFYVPGFPSDPALLALYDGVPVRLSVQTPDGQTPYAPLVKATSGGGRVSFMKSDFDAAGVFFDQAGTWRFKADFLGNNNFRATATADFDLTNARLTIKEGAGYAIVALGRLDENAEGHAEHAQTADFVYTTLRARGFDADDIAYLRDVLPGDPAPMSGVSFLTPNATTLQQVIEVWARDKMLASPAPLYLVLVDHGSPGVFHLDVGGTPEQESVTAADVDGWLSVLESALGGKMDGMENAPGKLLFAEKEVSPDPFKKNGMDKATGTDASTLLEAISKVRHCERSEAISAKYGAEIASSQAPRNDEVGVTEIASSQAPRNDEVGVAEIASSQAPRNDEVGVTEIASSQAPRNDKIGYDKSAAAEQPITVIYGACYSGSFLPVLSQPGRVIITSTASEEISYRGVLNQDTGVRDGEFFLMELFRNLGAGRSLKDGFELACAKTSDYTNTRSNGGTGAVPQHPLLDDNGDGTGTSGLLSIAPGADGANVAVLDLGLGVNAGTGISWFNASPPKFIQAGESIGEVLAQTTGRVPDPADTAWLEIKTPGYDSGEIATPGYEAYQRVAAMTGPIAPTELRDLGGGAYAYAWTQATLSAFPGFDGWAQAGTYKLYYFLRDGDTGQVGAYLITNIYVALPGNTPPGAVTLVYPPDAADAYTRPLFAWNPAVDPDGDAVTYHLQVSTDPGFPESATRIFTTGLTLYQVEESQALQDLTEYYWRVVPVDAYGARPVVHETRSFTTDNANPQIPGVIQGYVRDAATQAVIPGATVRVLPTGSTASTSVTGLYFVGNLPQGIYALEVTATGYTTALVTSTVVQSGRFTIADVELAYAGGNRPPVLQPIGSRQTTVGTHLEIACAATDPDPGDTLAWSVLNGPPRMSIDPTTGVLTYDPITEDIGAHPIVVQVTDDGDPALMTLEALTITVKDVNHPPVLEAIGNRSMVGGERLEIACHASDPDTGDVLTWRLVNAPARMGINENTGLLVYEPLPGETGTFTVTVEVTDNGLPPLTDSETITVTVTYNTYISGPSYAVIGDRVELEFHAPPLAGPWYVQWEHDDTVLPDENEELLVIESVTLDDAGWYTATQVTEDGKADPVSATFHLRVYETVPLRWGVLLAVFVCLALVVVRRAVVVSR